MKSVRVINANQDGTNFRAERVEPFGAACVALVGAWCTDWVGRQEGAGDARTIILPVPAPGTHERIEISDVPEG
jgi:hypothetical protein